MCGIVGYVGKAPALPILLTGLKTLEYRGYDSAGIAVYSKGSIYIKKSVGQVKELEKRISEEIVEGTLGIGHTRWATHGVPNEKNAHPHTDCTKRVYVTHNGIIENFKELREYLQKRSHRFSSDTDSEVIAHLIEDFLRNDVDFSTALFDTLAMIKGTYGLALIDANDPNTLYAARLSSPLVVGVGNGENFLASDPSALIGKTKNIIYLKDGEVAVIKKDKVQILDIHKQHIPAQIVKLEWSLEQAQKGNYPHFMLKEIFEGKETAQAALNGRLKANENIVKLGGLEQVKDQLKNTKRVIFLACGTSYYAGLVGEYLLEELSQIPTEVHIASEFRYREQPFDKNTVVIAISQSGETADTLAALRKAKVRGLLTLGVVNVVGSTISRETDAGVYNHAGPEIGVASTKAFISQLIILTLLSIYLSRLQDKEQHTDLLKELDLIPNKIQMILERSSDVEKLAKKYMNAQNFLYMGRRYSYPVALEGALKLKEISYVHAEGCAAGETKHGPIAMISKEFPTIAIVPKNSVSDKTLSNIEEIRARSGPIVAIATEGDQRVASTVDDVVTIPETKEPLEPLLAVIPLQLFAYYVGTLKGYDVDKPRNLAKSVTVE